MVNIKSKLPGGNTTIFTTMSALARKHSAINLSQGFPDYDCPDELKKLVHQYIDQEKHQYVPMAGLPALKDAIARKVNLSYGCNIDYDQVTITAGATQAIFTFITAMVNVGDEVIIFEPAYDSYLPSIKVAGGIARSCKMIAPEYNIDWDLVKKMINSHTRMIIINSPHNPTGTVLSEDDMEELDRITSGTDILILSDEVYEHLIYDGLQHQSILRYPSLFDRSIAVFSFGKTFHSTGWKIGYCIGPKYLVEEFRKVHQWNVFCVNSFLQYALADYLSETSNYDYLPDFYQQKRDFLSSELEESRLVPLPSKGTYFQLYDYSKISDMDDMAFAKKMTVEFGVACIPVSVFYTFPRQDGVIRLCFAKKESTLQGAAEKLRLL